MQKLVLIFACFTAASVYAENLPIPSELTRGVYVLSSKETNFCFDGGYSSEKQIVDGGMGIWINAKSLIHLEPETRDPDDLQPGCFDHTITTSEDDGTQTTVVSTSSEECKGKKPVVTRTETFKITTHVIDQTFIDGQGVTWHCSWRRKH